MQHGRPKNSQRSHAELAAVLKAARRAQGLSIQEVAEYLKRTPNQVRLYETGTVTIPLRDIFALSNYLNIDPALILPLIPKIQIRS
jgi:transcriptional regulator with XRE-family HTH domain